MLLHTCAGAQPSAAVLQAVVSAARVTHSGNSVGSSTSCWSFNVYDTDAVAFVHTVAMFDSVPSAFAEAVYRLQRTAIDVARLPAGVTQAALLRAVQLVAWALSSCAEFACLSSAAFAEVRVVLCGRAVAVIRLHRFSMFGLPSAQVDSPRVTFDVTAALVADTQAAANQWRSKAPYAALFVALSIGAAAVVAMANS